MLKEKMERYQKERGCQELEEYLKTVLDNEVKPLWPKGWMQSRYMKLLQIHAESLTSHFDFCFLILDLIISFQSADEGEQEHSKPLYAITVSTIKSSKNS